MKCKNRSNVLGLAIFVSGCAATLKPPEISKQGEIKDYSFVVLPKSASLQSTSSSIYRNENGAYGSSSSKEINPGYIIEGVLLKKGLFSTEDVEIDKEGKTVIIKYGESGRRSVAGGFGGYVLEVTIAILSAKTNEVVYSCVAEGQGTSESEDIRAAIHRCLSGL
jgi:hypothetical protein